MAMASDKQIILPHDASKQQLDFLFAALQCLLHVSYLSVLFANGYVLKRLEVTAKVVITSALAVASAAFAFLHLIQSVSERHSQLTRGPLATRFSVVIFLFDFGDRPPLACVEQIPHVGADRAFAVKDVFGQRQVKGVR